MRWLVFGALVVSGCGGIEPASDESNSSASSESGDAESTETGDGDGDGDACAWAALIGTEEFESTGTVALDSDGNIYVTASTQGGLHGHASIGSDDVFLSKYGADGEWRWTDQFGTNEEDRALGLAVDGADAVYIAGLTYGDLDGNVAAGGADVFIRKYTKAGEGLWTAQFGSAASDYVAAVAVDQTGDVYVTGGTRGDLDGNTSTGNVDEFLTKYTSDGAKLWTVQRGTGSGDSGAAIVIDANGDAYVAGTTWGKIDDENSFGESDVFLTKYTSDGTRVWTRQFGTIGFDDGYGVTVGSSGDVYVTGATDGDLSGNTSAGGVDLFLAKYTSTGTQLWTEQLGSTDDDGGRAVAMAGVDEVYVAGKTSGELDGNTSVGRDDTFVTKYDSTGARLWTRQFGSEESDGANSIAMNSDGSFYVSGLTNGDFDGGPTTAVGTYT